MRFRNILAACLGAVLLSSCGVTESELPSLEIRGMQIVSMLEEIAESEEYLSIYSADPELLNIIATFAEGDHSDPKTIYRLTLSEENVKSLCGTDVLTSLSPKLQDFLEGRVQASIINIANARGGSTALAATSICTAGRTFVSDEISSDTIYLYTFEDAVPVAVSFTVGESSTVTATGTFLIAEELNTDSPESIREFFSELDLTVEVVSVD
ncbi:MAG: hypothetical protein J6I42_00485 [Clostridia bacterium]|nr:hypothetical protein [Clostridia bacterium]MBO5119463.1 hypothetical protein [Methanocorpusculum sp.]